MEPPVGLFLDTDVLIQLYISRSQNILGYLKDNYGFSSLVVPEVASEITYSRKFGTRFQRDFRRACQARWVREMDANSYATIVNSSTDFQKCATNVSYSDIEHLGREYNLRVDRGEAYTHAAAVLLSQPVASNDKSAIDVLLHNGYQVPIPVLRTFDFIVFAYQTGFKKLSECNDIRRSLLGENERLPVQWKNASFEAGLKSFVPRLVDSACTYVGASSTSTKNNHYTTPLVVSKTKK